MSDSVVKSQVVLADFFVVLMIFREGSFLKKAYQGTPFLGSTLGLHSPHVDVPEARAVLGTAGKTLPTTL